MANEKLQDDLLCKEEIAEYEKQQLEELFYPSLDDIRNSCLTEEKENG